MEDDGAAPWLQPGILTGCSPTPVPQPPQPSEGAEKVPLSPAWKPWLMFFSRWTGWGSGVALVWDRVPFMLPTLEWYRLLVRPFLYKMRIWHFLHVSRVRSFESIFVFHTVRVYLSGWIMLIVSSMSNVTNTSNCKPNIILSFLVKTKLSIID